MFGYKSYEEFKDKLVLQIVPIKGNEKELEDVPYHRMADLAFLPAVYMELGDREAYGIMTDAGLKKYGVSKEKLLADTVRNSAILRPARVRRVEDALNELPGRDDERMWIYQHLYVAENGMNGGACVIAYPGLLEKVAEQMGSDVCCIPSSRHEFLLISKKDIDQDNMYKLSEIIKGINEIEVEPEDRLSDHAYIYSRADRTFRSIGRDGANDGDGESAEDIPGADGKAAGHQRME